MWVWNRDKFEGGFGEFHEFGGAFVVCLLTLGVRLMSLGVHLMSLGVGLKQELGDEFGVDFDEFDEFGGAFFVCSLHLEMLLMLFLGVVVVVVSLGVG